MSRKRIKKGFRYIKYIVYRETFLDQYELLWSFVGSFIGIGLIAYVHHFYLDQNDYLFLIGSFGASSVLIYGAIQSPLAQPRNLIVGHAISAIIGVSVQYALPDLPFIAAPLAVSFSIAIMQFTKTLHPPGGATALIAVIGSDNIKDLGFYYVLAPVLSGTLILFVVAILFNNISKNRKYPTSSRFTRIVKIKVKSEKSNG